MMKLLSKAILILCFLSGFIYAKDVFYKDHRTNKYFHYDVIKENINVSFYSYWRYSSCKYPVSLENDTIKKYVDKIKEVLVLSKSGNFQRFDYYNGYTSYDKDYVFPDYFKKIFYADKQWVVNNYLIKFNSCDFVGVDCDKYRFSCNVDILEYADKFGYDNIPFKKLFPLSFDLKKQLYDLSAKDRKDFFCRAKFGGSVSYANNTRVMPFYSNLRLIKSNNTALVDLDKRTNYFSFFKGKKGLAAFAGSAGFVAIKNFFELFTSGDDTYTIRPVRDLNQVCEFDCVDESGNIQTATIPYYYDLETKSIFNEALAVCSNATMRYYDFVYDNLDEAVSISLRKDEIALLEAEQEKITQEYFLMQNKEYYNELLKEYYDPSLDEVYSMYADTPILEQSRATYQAKFFETEKNNLLDMLNKGGFSETSIDYYKKYLDDETINKYRQAKIEADRRLEEILNGKDGGFKADENANSNTVTGVPPFDNNLTDNKTPPPPPLPPTNDKDGGFKGDITISKPGAVGGGIGTVSGIGNSVANDVVIGGNTNINDKAKDDINNQAQAQDKTKENSKADDVTITKDSTTTVDKTQTGSKVDVNVKTDVNVDVNVKVDFADIAFEAQEIDFADFENFVDSQLDILDSSSIFVDSFNNSFNDFLGLFGDVFDKLNDTFNYFTNLKSPQIVNPNYTNTCPLYEKINLMGYEVPFGFDVCKLLSIIYPATFSTFYIFIFWGFFRFTLKLAHYLNIFVFKIFK